MRSATASACVKSSFPFTNAHLVNSPASAGFAPAAEGALYVTGVGEQTRKGLVLPGTVTDAQHASKLTRWAVYVDGDLDDRLSAFVRNGRIVLDGKPGMYLIIR